LKTDEDAAIAANSKIEKPLHAGIAAVSASAETSCVNTIRNPGGFRPTTPKSCNRPRSIWHRWHPPIKAHLTTPKSNAFAKAIGV